jgi:hypothetical protein
VIEVEMPPSQPPASQVIEEWKQLAEKLERTSPRRSSDDVWDEILPRVMPFLHKKAEHSEIEYTLRGDHHDVSHAPRHYISLPSPTNIAPPGASYVNPNTLEHDAYPSTYPAHWVVDEGHSPLSQEEYSEESQEGYPPYVFNGFYGSFPPPDSVFMHAGSVSTMQFGGSW